MRRRSLFELGLLALSGASLVRCGYKVGGRADTVPRHIRSIYIPAFSNNTVRYRLTDRLPQEIAREFISRTRYRVVNSAEEADAILNGAVINYQPIPTIFDPASGRASAVQFVVTLAVSLTDKNTGQKIFNRPAFNINQRYEISTKPEVFLDESDSALDRVSREVARSVVSAILEGF